ncbi:phage BR0599 family protein [Amaricoccus sp. W119]|uniref:phage BR0599 family protein n=1 Tax=Amaricoccus sp. W119 TaxID=3391833 RepID=UPI0039A428D6
MASALSPRADSQRPADLDQRRQRRPRRRGDAAREGRRRQSDAARGAGARDRRGDGFTLVAGCDKTAATCASKFANIANFRGFPHIPGQDTVLRYAKPGAANSGEPL